MGTYNLLYATIVCPPCVSTIEAEIKCLFGDTSQLRSLRLGEVYPWHSGKAKHNGSRPPEGTTHGAGHLQCPACDKDMHLRVCIERDIVVDVEPDAAKLPYIDPSAFSGAATISYRSSPALRWQRLEYIPPVSRFRDHVFEREIIFEQADGAQIVLGVAASEPVVEEIGHIRCLLDRCAHWILANQAAIASFCMHHPKMATTSPSGACAVAAPRSRSYCLRTWRSSAMPKIIGSAHGWHARSSIRTLYRPSVLCFTQLIKNTWGRK